MPFSFSNVVDMAQKTLPMLQDKLPMLQEKATETVFEYFLNASLKAFVAAVEDAGTDTSYTVSDQVSVATTGWKTYKPLLAEECNASFSKGKCVYSKPEHQTQLSKEPYHRGIIHGVHKLAEGSGSKIDDKFVFEVLDAAGTLGKLGGEVDMKRLLKVIGVLLKVEKGKLGNKFPQLFSKQT